MEHDHKCYFATKDVRQTYDDAVELCASMSWASTGYPIMPKDRKQLYFANSLARP